MELNANKPHGCVLAVTRQNCCLESHRSINVERELFDGRWVLLFTAKMTLF